MSLFAQDQFSNFFGFGQFPQPNQFVNYLNVGGSAPPAQRLRPPFTLTRAQLAGVRAAAISRNGVTWQEYAADLARFNGLQQGLLIERQATNAIQQPVAVASATGAWGAFGGSGATHTFTPNFSVAPNGLTEAARARWQGAATNTPTLRIPTFGVVSGTSYQVSGWIFSRSLSGLSSSVNLDIGDGAGRNIFSQLVLDQWVRFQTNVTAGLQQWLDIQFAWLSGDLDLDLWGVQVEIAPFTTSLVRPPSATPGASTRGQDFVSAALTNLGISASGNCSVLMSLIINNATTAGTGNFGILSVDDGTANNRLTVRTDPTGILAERVTAGVTSTGAMSATYTANNVVRLGLSLNGAGAARLFVAGGAVQGVTGGPSSGLTTLRLGINGPALLALDGQINTCRVLPYSMSDAQLQSEVNAL